MVEQQAPQRRRRRRRQVPSNTIPLAQRAEQLGMTTASLRRYVNLGQVEGRVDKVGNRIYVAHDLSVTAPRAQRKIQSTAPSGVAAQGRYASVTRETAETNVQVTLNLDGQGQYQVATGSLMLDHLLAQVSRHSLIDLTVTARGDDLPDHHHLAEDVAIVLGRALRQAIGEGEGIRRMGSAMAPLDEALAQVTVDVGGRGYAVMDLQLSGEAVGGLGGALLEHFLERLAIEGGVNLHAHVLAGRNAHHKVEAAFKAFARALRAAVEEDPRAAGAVASTKGTISS